MRLANERPATPWEEMTSQGVPRAMRAWVTKLDEFLKISDRELLDHAGTISAEVAKAKADREYERYRALQDATPRAIDAEFEKVAKQLRKPAPPPRPTKGKKR